ncbi:MAG: hypothetical protein WCH21_06965 [Bacteroidota bacterium]
MINAKVAMKVLSKEIFDKISEMKGDSGELDFPEMEVFCTINKKRGWEINIYATATDNVPEEFKGRVLLTSVEIHDRNEDMFLQIKKIVEKSFWDTGHKIRGKSKYSHE